MYYNKNSFSMYYERHGNGIKNILILPGWGDTRCTFQLMIDYLKLSYTVYIVDYPGFGKSIFPDVDMTIYDYTNLIRDFIKDEKINNPTIIAHSFGGRIATLLSGYYKDNINKLILIDAAGIKPKRNIFKKSKTIIYKFLKRLKILFPKRLQNIYLKRLLYIFGSKDYKSLKNNMYNTFKNIVNEDLKFYIKNINCPTLIIWGNLDKDTPLKDGLYFYKVIKNKQLRIIKNAGHFCYLDFPNEVINIIDIFLKQTKKEK